MKHNTLTQHIAAIIKNQQVYKIVFFGDSITSAEWVHPNWREMIEYVLKKELNKIMNNWQLPSWYIRTINSGLDGSTSADWLKYKESYIFDYKPDLAISIFGGNDSLFNLSLDDHVTNIQTLVNELSKRLPNAIFCSTTPGLDGGKLQSYGPYHQALKKVVFPDNVKYIDLFIDYQRFDRTPLFTFKYEAMPEFNIKAGDVDTDHPNQLGNAYIAKLILKQGFNLRFNPDRYIQNTLAGEKYPSY